MAPKKVISQSKTQYIKKGDKLSDGSVAKKGYVARKGNDLKKVTANIKLETETRGKKAGTVVKAQAKAKPGSKGGGKTPAQLKAEAAARAKAAKAAKEKAAKEKAAAAAKKVADAKKAKAMLADKKKGTQTKSSSKSPAGENKPKAGARFLQSGKTNKKVDSEYTRKAKYKAAQEAKKKAPKIGDVRTVDTRSGLGYLTDKGSKVKQVYTARGWVKA